MCRLAAWLTVRPSARLAGRKSLTPRLCTERPIEPLPVPRFAASFLFFLPPPRRGPTLVGPLTGWPADWLDWLADWLTGCLADWLLMVWLTDSLAAFRPAGWKVGRLADWQACRLAAWLTGEHASFFRAIDNFLKSFMVTEHLLPKALPSRA